MLSTPYTRVRNPGTFNKLLFVQGQGSLMLRIVSSEAEPQYPEMLRERVLSEWGNVDPFDGNHPEFKIPAPLLAISGENLIGGLSFTSYPVPGENYLGL